MISIIVNDIIILEMCYENKLDLQFTELFQIYKIV